ncbi:SusC/RagA family TonB-linked outer membrane protein [Sphingobacterium oryzagri]|uniref:SusC/RagA family TonB-linked outer membrane protein n=1 Tax=Sphingobacterium oryzagri TaxID=3025669 RepID=A0ABY7WJZ6_9SPHI|nr:SusC/RagA family TonB-linked outer membrane protein [Sphingobacterium sp. KACC 22765]WDF69918.1 SusC/RagA family TonB-linked outer membrane protein [Sphingobacterium sp. KACC 22765]
MNKLYNSTIGQDKNSFWRITSTMIVLLLLSVISVPVFAQSTTITGVVSSATDQSPLVGVTVRIKGGDTATSTDQNGSFSIQAATGDILQFSYIAFLPEEVKIGNANRLQVVMRSDSRSMEEVVVVGFGTARKSEITAASTNIKAEDFRQGAARNAMDLLQGKVAGLQVSRSGSNPNTGVALQLRGVTSISGTNSPLVVIDGIPGGNLDLLQQADIESINVLKDGSAAAIYGTQANGGVILVTTKKGAPGKTRFDYSTYINKDFLQREPDFLSADEFRQKIDEGFMAETQDFGANVNAIDEMVKKNNFSQYHTLAISGGGENNNFRASTYYRDLQSIAKENGRTEYGVRANFNGKGLDDRLTTQVDFVTNLNNANLLGGGGWEWAYTRNPTLPIKNEDGSWFYDQTSTNQVARLYEEHSRRQQQTTTISGTVGYEIIKDLKFNMFGSMQRNSWVDGYYATLNSEPAFKDERKLTGSASQSTVLEFKYAFEPTISFNRIINDVHSFNAVAGYSYRYDVNQGFNAANRGFQNDVFEENNMGAGTALTLGYAGIGSYKNDNKIIGFLGRLIYSFDSKYTIQGTFRRDGSSRFGANNKWGNFGSLGAAWNISSEDFMQNVTFVNDLKLRASYGVTGNQDIPNYRSLVTLGTGNNYIYPDGVWRQTYGPDRNPNPNLRWETKSEYNAGVDFMLFDGRLGGAIDVYKRITKDLLGNYTSQQPPFIRNFIFTNVGQISSRGVELTLNAIPVRNENVTWTIDLIGSSNRNRMDSFSNDTFKADANDYGSIGGAGALGNAIRTFEGGRIGDFYGKRFAGFSEDGKWLFYKRDGSVVPFNEINDSRTDLENTDLAVLGNAIPKYYLSINSTVRYKNFDFRIFFRGRFDYDILNTMQLTYGNRRTLPNNVLHDAFDKHADLDDTYMYSDYYLESGSHLKLDELTLGYTFKLNSERVRNLRIYATGTNLALFTKYTGNDPEFIGDTGLGPGIDNRGMFPNTRSLLMGLNIGF